MDHKPSVVAAAATLLALDQTLTIEDVRMKMSSTSQIEPVSFLYSLKSLLEKEHV